MDNVMLTQQPVAEKPKPPGKRNITKENAKQLSALAAQAKALKLQNTPPLVRSGDQATDYAYTRAALTSRTQSMLFATIARFDKCKSPESTALLAGAFQKLFQCWAHLTCTPAPGQLRPDKMMGRMPGMKAMIAQVMATPTPISPAQPVPETESKHAFSAEPGPVPTPPTPGGSESPPVSE